MSKHTTCFTVLIERRALPRMTMLGLALLAAMALLVGQRAQATPHADGSKPVAATAAANPLVRDL